MLTKLSSWEPWDSEIIAVLHRRAGKSGLQILKIFIVSFLIFFSPSERVECKFYKHKLLNRYTLSVKMERWLSGENFKPDSKSEKIKYYFD